LTTRTTVQLNTCLNQRITVFADDHIGDNIRRYGLHEKERLLVLRQLLQRLPAAIVLDIGANIGNHTLVFATCAAHVHAFEPLPTVHTVLSANIADNGLQNVSAHAVALSDQNGAAEFFIGHARNVGMSSFDQRHDHTGKVEVLRRIGDEFLAELGVSKIDFLKIDVEGHEYFALSGLLKTLQRDLPVITLEWNDPVAINRFDNTELWRFLTDSYSFVALDTTHDRTVWQGQPFSFFKRKWHRLRPRRPVIHGFDLRSHYDCVVLVPKGREALLAGLAAAVV
jgi:FkbM family methyltransferase